MKRTMTFEEWAAQRRYEADLGLVVPGFRQPEDADVPTPGLVYPNGYYIQHWVDARHGYAPKDGVPCYILTLTSSEFVGVELAALERRLYEYAKAEGGCDEEAPDLTPGEVFDFVAGCVEMGCDGSPLADAGHEMSVELHGLGSEHTSWRLTVDGARYQVLVVGPLKGDAA